MSVNDERPEFDPPTPDDRPPREARMQQEAFALEGGLREYALKLGLKIRVVYDAYNWGFKIYAAVLSPNEAYTIDEEILVVRQPSGSTAVADLLRHVLDDLQLKLYDNMARAMTATDVRERQYILSKEDKETLHRMYMDALNARHSDFYRAEENMKVTDKYRELMSRLFR